MEEESLQEKVRSHSTSQVLDVGIARSLDGAELWGMEIEVCKAGGKGPCGVVLESPLV